MSDSANPWTATCQASLSFTNSQNLLKLMSIESLMPSNHLILCRPLLLLPSIFPSIRIFSNELALSIRWPKYWGFNLSPSKEYSGLISFRIDWFDLLAVQGTLKSQIGSSVPFLPSYELLFYYLYFEYPVCATFFFSLPSFSNYPCHDFSPILVLLHSSRL